MMETSKTDVRVKRRTRHWWPVPVLAGVGLVVVVMMASASIAAPQDIEFYWRQLSAKNWFAAYPDMDVGANGLVAAVWTEGPDDVNKHSGRLKLAWARNNSAEFVNSTVIVEGSTSEGSRVLDAAVAVSGDTIHMVWSRETSNLNIKAIRYASCTWPNCASFAPETIATGDDALQVDITIDGSGRPHVVWVEKDANDDKKLHYARKDGTWSSERLAAPDDGEGPAIVYANDFIHLVWTEWTDPLGANTDAVIEYCRRHVTSGSQFCDVPLPLSTWDDQDYLARNLSIAADEDGHVYVVWDVKLPDGRYAIAYKHSKNNGFNWQPTHTYLDGSEFGTDATSFKSGEGQSFKVEYVHYLRPHVSLAVSGTAMVPVLAWHRWIETGGVIGPGLAQVAADNPYKVLWTYATRPGSIESTGAEDGTMFWATQGTRPFSMTLSTDRCGDVALRVSSSSARLAIVGDLQQAITGESPSAHVHTVYHEQTGGNLWGVFYNSTHFPNCSFVYLPFAAKNASSGGEG